MTAAQSLSRVLRFGAFEVDLRAGELRKHGSNANLQAQPFQVLLTLLERPGEIVTREELRKRLWSADTFVDFEDGLNTCIRKIRQALGDSADNPRFVETLPRRGYRFIAKVEGLTLSGSPDTPLPAGAPDSSRPQEKPVDWPSWRGVPGEGAELPPAAGAGRRPGTDVLHLAVLPFTNTSGDPDKDYLSDGMAEALISKLSELPGLKVMSLSAVAPYRTGAVNLQAVGRDLGVRVILAGRVTVRGDLLALSMELVDTRDNTHIWGEHYDRKLDDILEVQDEIASAITGKLRLKLTEKERQRLTQRSTGNTSAYRAYLRGRYYENKRTPESLQKSVECFTEAIEKDSGFAQAYAGLASCYTILGSCNLLPPPQSLVRARDAALKALEMNDGLAEAHMALGIATLLNDWNWPAAGKEFRRAIQLNPRDANAHYFYGLHYLCPQGRHNEALREMNLAREFAPLSLVINTNQGRALYYARQYDLAIRHYGRMLELEPNFLLARAFLIWAYEQQEMYELAAATAEKCFGLTEIPGGGGASLRDAYRTSGAQGYWRERLRLLEALAQVSHVTPSHAARVHARLGEHDQALRSLETAHETRDFSVVFLKVEPAFDSLHSEHRFQSLVQRIGLPES
ncbi:MAG TPA: winged helix-turn-helix domain-containing protein [Terriglobia bacterium]|nr:winged helix-turn-helix domain-containing protein [Terriglobia bacterium]